MTEQWIGTGALGVLAVLAVVLAVGLAVALARTRSRTRRELEAARAETAALRSRIDEIQRALAPPEPRSRPEPPEFRITELGRPEPAAAPATIDRALFADLVLRETVVRAASLAHGVRRALAPETRNRVRFEVGREVRRARRQRRADLRQARRDWEARQRAALDDEDAA